MTYRHLLLDADDTLFDFARCEAEALRSLLPLQVPDPGAALAAYRDINALLWRNYQKGFVTQEFLRIERFKQWVERLGFSGRPEDWARRYEEALARQSHLLPGVQETLEALANRFTLSVITNGISRIQRQRIQASPLAPWLKAITISEEIGAAKPDPAIFVAALKKLKNPPRGTVLVVGDSLEADIAGAQAAGLSSAWLGRGRDLPPKGPRPDHVLEDFSALADLLA